MLDSLEPPEKKYKRPSISELLEKIENHQKRLTGLLKYYSLFIHGMYEFDQKEYVEAIHYYREAEKELNEVTDEIEKAEFHYKLADAYYQIDQHYVSLNHLAIAKSLFESNNFYKVKVIGCNMMFGANMYRLSEAEAYYREALHKAEHLKGKQANRITGVIHHNLGLVSTRGGNLTDAEYFFRRALE